MTAASVDTGLKTSSERGALARAACCAAAAGAVTGAGADRDRLAQPARHQLFSASA